MKKLFTLLLLFFALNLIAQEPPTDIKLIQSPSFWHSDSTTSVHWYNDLKNSWSRLYDYWTIGGETTPLKIKYGYLYNWYALNDTVRTVTPYLGYLYNWYALATIANTTAHVPTSTEWTAFKDYLTTQEAGNEGGILKETGYTYWMTPNSGATNSTGFNLKGAGFRVDTGDFQSYLQFGSFWFSDEFDSAYGNYSIFSYDNTTASEDNSPKQYGFSVRLIVDSPTEISGDYGIYTGNDGQRYHCKLYHYGSGVWWITENLIETKTVIGSTIPVVTDNTTWSGLTDAAMCEYPGEGGSMAYSTSTVVYSIANTNAHVPTSSEWGNLISYLSSNAGGKLKETGNEHWLTPNSGATNETKFTALGSGARDGDGPFMNLTFYYNSWSSNVSSSFYIGYGSGNAYTDTDDPRIGYSVRLIVDTPNHDNGDNTGTYIGNDGVIYKCVKINGIWYTAESLIETKWSNGASIPVVTNGTTWADLTTPARCSYDNDITNAYTPATGTTGINVRAANKVTFASTPTINWITTATTDSTATIQANATTSLFPFYTTGSDTALISTIKHGTSYGDNLIIGQEDPTGTKRDTTFTGSSNTLFGSRVAIFLSKGSGNTGIGNAALYPLGRGSFNTAIGMQAGGYLEDWCMRNTMIGAKSGWNPDALTGHGSFVNDSDIVVIGYGATKSDTSGILHNSIAIGNNSLINKSNQVVIGNDNTTETILKGTVNISKLKVTDGAANNKILKSDSDGLLSYSDFPALPDTVDNHQQVSYIPSITGSGSLTDLSGITSTYTPKGTKALILFSANIVDSGSHVFNCYIDVNGSTALTGICQTYTNAAQYQIQVVFAVNKGSSNTIKIQWDAGSTVQARNSSMSIIDLP